MSRNHWLRYTALCLFLLLGLLSYRRALTSDFILDDTIRIATPHAENGRMEFTPLPAYEKGLISTLTEILPDRPLLMLTLWANYKVGGNDPFSYKLVNVLLHILNALLVVAMLLEVAEFFGKKRDPWLAIPLGLIFLLHPLNNQAVTMVIQRGVLLAFCFGLLSLHYGMRYLKDADRSNLLHSAAFFLLAILCKPNALVVPLLLCLLASLSGRSAHLRSLLGPLVAAFLFPLALYMVTKFNYQPGTGDAQRWLQYFLIQIEVVIHYLRQTVWPFGFNAFYDISLQPRVADPAFLVAAAFHLFVLGWGAMNARRGRLAGIGLCAFYISLLPESSVFPIHHVVFDHRMYLPFPFLLLAAYGLLTNEEGVLSRPAPHRAAMAALAVIALVLGFLNDGRNRETGTYPRLAGKGAGNTVPE